MFTNQYAGNRSASKSLPRNLANGPPTRLGPYSRLDVLPKFEPPVNARLPEDEMDEVDYSFSNLTVRERKNLLLNKVANQQQGHHAFTLPRNRSCGVSQARLETQSEFGGARAGDVDDAFLGGVWGEPSISNSPWGSRSQHGSPPRTSTGFSASTSRTLDMAASRLNQLQQPRNHVQPATRTPTQFATGPFASASKEPISRSYSPVTPTPVRVSRPTYRPQFSTTMRINDPSTAATNAFYGSGGGSPHQVNRVVPVKRYSNSTGSAYGDRPWDANRLAVSSRVVQPLRVNVYNSDGYGSHAPSVTSYGRGASSPVYPAYPAYTSRPQEPPTQVYLSSTSSRSANQGYYQPVNVYTTQAEPGHTTYRSTATANPSSGGQLLGTYRLQHGTRGMTPRPVQLQTPYGQTGFAQNRRARGPPPAPCAGTNWTAHHRPQAMPETGEEAGVSEF